MPSMRTPPSTEAQRRQAVFDATGQNIKDEVQVFNNGISNEVLGIETLSSEQFILRTSIRQEARAFYLAERWATREAATIGVTVPKVFGVMAYEDKAGIRYTSVETRLPGIPMSEYLEEHPEEEIRLAESAGEMLRKINSIPVERFDYIDKRFIWRKDSLQEILTNPWYGLNEMLKIAPEINLDPEVLHKIFKRYRELCAKFPDLDPVLLHNDYQKGNIMVRDGKVSGTFDMELAAGGDYVREHARWALQTKNPESTEAFINSWHGTLPRDPDFDLRLETWKIQIPLLNIRYFYTVTDDFAKEIIEANKNKLIEMAGHL
jgi:aminoglycoside phosphotransferase (APT) family kinase protein